MNNIGDLINNSIPIIKKGSLFIVTLIGLFSNSSSIDPNIINNSKISTNSPTEKIEDFIPKAVKNTAAENTKKILKVTNVPINTDKIVQTAKKLNSLNLIAPSYSNLDITKKNTQIQTETKKIIGSTNSIAITAQGSEESVVNIRCENKINNSVKVITGSGVLISSSGLILTAAHVAAPVYAQQKGGNYNCYARIKNPASGNYPVAVVFINPSWVNKHYSEFDKPHSESGESDIAILQIDNSKLKLSNTDISNLNNTAKASLSLNVPNLNDSISIKAYPSDVYGKLGIYTSLARKSEGNSIGGLLNFSGTIDSPFDLIETKPSSIGQSGASGGGLFNNQGQLIGIISNMVSSDILLKNKIRALSIKYIDNEIKKNLGTSIFYYNQ
jgi:hypothetical protein